MKKIEKEKVPVVVYTGIYRIKGNLHVVPGTRLTDMLNVKMKDFLPLTEVTVLDARENVILAEVPYLALYREAIIAVHPIEKEELKQQAKQASTANEG